MTLDRSLLAALAAALYLVVGAGCAGPDAANARPKVPEDRDPAVLTDAGQAFADAGDVVRAEQYFAAALAAGADERKVLPLLLRVCVASKHLRLAAEYAELALARHPERTHLRFLTGALYVSIGESGKAVSLLEQAARELPTDAELQFAVAVVYRDDLSDVVRADRYFRDYLRLEPSGAHAGEARASLMERIE